MVFLEISQNSQESNCAWVAFLIKLQASDIETLAQVFSREFCEIYKNTFSTEHLQVTASYTTRLTDFYSNSRNNHRRCSI